MNQKIIHRGPDGNGFFLNDRISLGQVRLSIIDLSKAGRQPLFYSSKIGSFYYNEENQKYENIDHENIDINSIGNYYTIVFNGEIYNYQSIKDTLEKKGYIFTTNTDTEVILAAYEEYGEDCHNLFDGMRAFCIYNPQKNILVFSRDRFGIKPLYYYIDINKNIIFSSEIKAILEYEGYQKKPNEEMIFRYLYMKNDTDIKQTFFNGIYKFPNAHYGVFNLRDKEFITKRYRDLRVNEYYKNLSNNELYSRTRDLFFDTLKLHIISDVEVGCCLSGGIDSSSIACSLNYLGLTNEKNKLKTFSCVFRGDNSVDESKFIDCVTNSISCKPYSVTPSSETLEKDLKEFVYCQEEPVIGTSQYIQYKVMELAHKNGIKVTLDGQGGDEIFGGYNTFYPYHLLYLLKKGKFIKFVKYLCGMRKYYSKSLFKGIVFPLLYLGYLILPDSVKKLYYKKHNKIVKGEYVDKYNHVSLHKKYKNDLGRFYYYHQMENIQHLLRYGDKSSMRWGVESRVPFLEKSLVEFIGLVPFDKKIPNGLPKNILRESMDGILPSEIKNRYDKKGFESPEDKWLKTSNMEKYIRDIFNRDTLFVGKYINVKEFLIILDSYFKGKNKEGSLVWYVLNLELWGREFF